MKESDNYEFLKRFGNLVRMARTNQDMSQEQLAEKAGLHRTYIGMVERGEKNITIINIYKIANALGISISKLVEKI